MWVRIWLRRRTRTRNLRRVGGDGGIDGAIEEESDRRIDDRSKRGIERSSGERVDSRRLAEPAVRRSEEFFVSI
ncbi:MAG: hypothetical protein E6Q40_00765 [Cupriavidus sp.]|nr:MAG: hypothetical protein E6Q40_00765 [Cupriavidus sp.]